MSRKQDILDEALKLFNKTNTQCQSTNHIAASLGISPGNLHYHYKNKNQIIRLLYIQMKNESILDIDKLPRTIEELNKHKITLVKIQWKYRFFFKEILFLLSKDKELETMYIADNIAHFERIKISIKNFVVEKQIRQINESELNFIANSILMTWQFYTSHLQTLNIKFDKNASIKLIEHTNNILDSFKIKDKKKYLSQTVVQG